MYVFERIARLGEGISAFEVLTTITETLRHVLMLVIDVQCFDGTTHLDLWLVQSVLIRLSCILVQVILGAQEACS